MTTCPTGTEIYPLPGCARGYLRKSLASLTGGTKLLGSLKLPPPLKPVTNLSVVLRRSASPGPHQFGRRNRNNDRRCVPIGVKQSRAYVRYREKQDGVPHWRTKFESDANKTQDRDQQIQCPCKRSRLACRVGVPRPTTCLVATRQSCARHFAARCSAVRKRVLGPAVAVPD